MTKKVKLMPEYSLTIPLWYGDGWNKSGPIETNQADLESLKLSAPTITLLKELQKPVNDYFKIMEEIPGGGWGGHSVADYELARLKLNIPEAPNVEKQKETYHLLINKLGTELKDNGFELDIH